MNSPQVNQSEALYNYLRGIDWQTAKKHPYLENHTAEKKQLLMKIAASKSGKQILHDLQTYANQIEAQRKQQKRFNLFTMMDEKSDSEWIRTAVSDALYYAYKHENVRDALPEIFADDKEEPLMMLKI